MSVDEVRAAILSGALIRMGFANGERVWWIDDPYTSVDDLVMVEAMRGHNGDLLLEEAFDSLFGWPGNSQTWVSVYA